MRAREQLLDHLFANIFLVADAADDQARGHGDHQRRNLRDQTIANSQQHIVIDRQ
jgi:hypothetical protein